jgi:hypothetical protein
MSDLRERVDALVKKLRGTIQDADGWPKQSYLDGVHDAADKFRALLAQSEEAKPAPADCLCSSWVGKANPACPVHGTPPASAGTEGVGALDRWAGAARKLFAMMIRKPYGTWNECRICGGTWWDDERPRHRLDCAAVAALAEGEKR